ncbi:MAG: hypothetical protein JXA71_10530, partial [Chitinispirillaceae bacterium]|nr:hypothetical protein [Chitinispirillaceae bacterium]
LYYADVIRNNSLVPSDLFSSLEGDGEVKCPVINFEYIFSQTPFIKDIREILAILKKAYGCHVDIEFTANFLPGGTYRINLLQCRPHQGKKGKVKIGAVPRLDPSDIILQTRKGVIGQSREIVIDRIVFVVPSVYGNLPERDRYAVSRLIGNVVRHDKTKRERNILLIGPGRWGTQMPSLGVPVAFSEISTVSAICEVDVMHEGLKPDLSMGTHFFNDLVEMNILYIGLFVGREENILNEDFLLRQPNRLSRLLPESDSWSAAVRVVDGIDIAGGKRICLNADSMKQSCMVYVTP